MAGEGEQVFIQNHDYPFVDFVRLTPDQPNQPLPAYNIPDSMAIVIMNNPANNPALVVLVDHKPVTPTSWPLIIGNTMQWYLKNSGRVYVGIIGKWPAGVTQAIVNYTFEMDDP